MLPTLGKMKLENDKWGIIKDDNGNVATFAKYKCNYWPAYEMASND